MLTKRIIPCLDIKNGKVVKGINFVGLREIGDPVELAKIYSTPKSAGYINGMLDSIARHLINTGVVLKPIAEKHGK